MQKKFVILIFLLLFLSSCATKKVVDESFYKRYGLNESRITLYSLSYNELNNAKKEKIDGIVLVLKDTCDYCNEFMKSFVSLVEDIENCETIYVLESNILSSDEKNQLYENYFLSSVPSILKFEKGNF